MKYFMKLVLITWLSLAVKADDESPPEELDLEADMQDIVPFVGNGSVSPQMPFMVSVRRTTHELTDRQFGNGHICGGVVISRNHILTAASCIQIRENRIPTSEIFVIAGTRYRYVNDKNVRSAARNISIHPNYSFDPLMNNLAIIEVVKGCKINFCVIYCFLSLAQHNIAWRWWNDFSNWLFKYDHQCWLELPNLRMGFAFIG